MDWGFAIQIVLGVLGAALIVGGIVAYRGSRRAGARGFAAGAAAAGGVMWAIILVTLQVSYTSGGPQEPTVGKVKAISASGTPESTEVGLVRSMKGYELYSWQGGGGWRFALLIGTNRLKTHSEVTSPDNRVQGTEALKRELSRLPSEERMFWSARRVEGLTMPPDDIISEISTHSAQLGIQLEVDR